MGTCAGTFKYGQNLIDKIRLVQLPESSFLEALRRKLHWRGTYL